MIDTAALPLVDWVVLGLYFAAMLGVGWYFYRSGRSSTVATLLLTDWYQRFFRPVSAS